MHILRLSGLFLFLSLQLHAQEFIPDLQDKYWVYRSRFYQQFIRIDWGGDGIGKYIPMETPKGDPQYPMHGLYQKAGYSMPASEYLPLNKEHWKYLEGMNCGGQDARYRGPQKGVLVWGGDDIIELGYYMALLATEYALLERHKQPTERIREEIYLAQQAYHRLDKTANQWLHTWNKYQHPDCTWKPQLDGLSGLAIRNDIPATFWQNFPQGQASGVLGGRAACTLDDLPYYNIDQFRSTLSQDQMIGLLFGLAFLKKYLPPEATWNGESLLARTQTLGKNLLNLVQPRIIRLPDCIDRKLTNSEGGHLHPYYKAFAHSVNYIVGEKHLRTNIIDEFLWGIMQANCLYGEKPCIISHNYDNFVMFYKLLVISGLKNSPRIQKMSLNKYRLNAGFYPIAHALLYDVPSESLEPIFYRYTTDLLLSAPYSGPCTPARPESSQDTIDCRAAAVWRTERRWGRRENAPGVIDNSYKNGMGYMLMYNMYHLFYFQDQNYQFKRYSPETIANY